MTERLNRRLLTISVSAAFACLAPAIASSQEQPDSASRPISPLEAVVVSATRSDQSIGNLPTPVKVLGASALSNTPASAVTDLLRTIPGFTTRDFQTGIMSGPSQSIVTFRGLTGSSAGRALVLLDGIPVGDPFSGWIDWGRIPLPMIASAEVIRGGGSMVWGSRALAGVINLRTIAPRRDGATMLVERGTFDTWHGSGSATVKRGKFSAILGADYHETEGYVLLPPHQAGSVDIPQSMKNKSVAGKVTYDATPSLQVWAGGSSFKGGERPFGEGDEQLFDEGRAGLRWAGKSNGVATVSLFANDRLSRSRSYTVNSDRSSQSPQRFGNSPANSFGLTAQWTQIVKQNHELTTGVDYTSASGSLSEVYAFSAGEPTQERKSGAAQEFAGIFIQDAADIGDAVRMVASARVDRVHSSDAARTIRSLPQRNILSDSAISDQTDLRLTYSLGFRRQQASWLALRVNGYESFRAPSMYEMYHPRFSGRGTVTEANSGLEAERLRGVEGGVDIVAGRTVFARVTGYTNRVLSPIMDITIGVAGTQPEVIAPCGLMPAGQTCSQRQNVPRLRSNGVETEFSWHPFTPWTLGGGYSYSATRVGAPDEPTDGKRALRSAAHTAMANIAFDRPRWFAASVEARYVGPRFEDDLNTIELDEFYLVGLRVNRDIGPRIAAHLKIENLLDEEFQITRTRSGIAEMGPRRWVTLGLRTTW